MAIGMEEAKRKKPSGNSDYSLTADLFLRYLSLIYAIAFASIWYVVLNCWRTCKRESNEARRIQIPGLYGKNGLLPVTSILKNLNAKGLSGLDLFSRLPTHLVILTDVMWVDCLLDCSTLLGLFISLLSARYGCGNVAMFLQFFLYLSVYNVGQTFLHFQWDILLLETGFAAVLLAKAGIFASWSKSDLNPPHSALFLLRFVLFKLMFMSGFVKLQANCPTWNRLTACHYHFATQCIPTPLAWYFHQLPSILLKVSVAATLWIEIPATIFIIMPFRATRKYAGFWQMLLQLFIIVSGNYNFFNLLTIGLCICLFDDGMLKRDKMGGKSKISLVRLMSHLLTFCIIAYTIQTVVSMFKLILFNSKSMDLILSMRFERLQKIADKLFPYIFLYSGAALVVLGLYDIVTRLRHAKSIVKATLSVLWRMFMVAVCILTFLSGAVPFSKVVSNADLPQTALKAYEYSQPWSIVGGYGLFRRMTGVGDRGEGILVSRPEIEIEGSYDMIDWKPYTFGYKPGSPSRAPPWVAPHQPRLDWQMWFQALNPNLEPWFVHLVYKLLINEPSVLALLGKNDAFASKPPKYIRALRYNYDFTRLSNDNHTNWWQREFVGEFLRPLTKDEPALKEYVIAQGWDFKSTLETAEDWLKNSSEKRYENKSLEHILLYQRPSFLLYLLIAFTLVTTIHFLWSKSYSPQVKGSASDKQKQS